MGKFLYKKAIALKTSFVEIGHLVNPLACLDHLIRFSWFVNYIIAFYSSESGLFNGLRGIQIKILALIALAVGLVHSKSD